MQDGRIVLDSNTRCSACQLVWIVSIVIRVDCRPYFSEGNVGCDSYEPHRQHERQARKDRHTRLTWSPSHTKHTTRTARRHATRMQPHQPIDTPRICCVPLERTIAIRTSTYLYPMHRMPSPFAHSCACSCTASFFCIRRSMQRDTHTDRQHANE